MEGTTRAISIGKLLRLEYVIYLAAFLVPLVLNHQQLIVGCTVNALLFISARKLSKKHLVPLAVLPSIAALANGLLFGPFTPFLLYFLPFIWIGNLALMYVFKYAKSFPSVLGVICAAVAKSALLFAAANVFVNFSVVPKIFLTAMGQLQLITALAGGAAAMIVLWKLRSN